MKRLPLAAITLCLLFAGGARALSTASDATLISSRDPFQPPHIAPCRDTLLSQWQLRGVIGDGLRWVGWLASPQHPWLKITLGDVVPETGWRITHLNQDEIRLMQDAAAMGCQTMASEWTLPAPGVGRWIMDKGLE